MVLVDFGLGLVCGLICQPITALTQVYDYYFETPLKEVWQLHGYIDDLNFMDQPYTASLKFKLRNGTLRLKDSKSFNQIPVEQLKGVFNADEIGEVVSALYKPAKNSSSSQPTGAWLAITREGKYVFLARMSSGEWMR